MKLKGWVALAAIGVAAYSGYTWLTRVSPTDSVAQSASSEADRDPKQRAISEMAKFLEEAPAGQLKAMNVHAKASRESLPTWNSLLPYTHRAEKGIWIAQMLSEDGPMGTAEEARKNLLENPSRTLEDVQIVLSELPETRVGERAELLGFLGEVGMLLEDRTAAEGLLLKEAQKVSGPRDVSDPNLISQAVALREYYRLETDHTKRYDAYKSALEAQTDPVVKAVIQRFEVLFDNSARGIAGAPAPAPVAAAPPVGAPAVPNEPVVSPPEPSAETAAVPAAVENTEREPAASQAPAEDPDHPNN